MEKFEKLDNEQKELVKYWIIKYAFNGKLSRAKFIEKHLTPEPVIEVGKWYITTDKEGNEYLFNHQDRGSSYGFFKGKWISENWSTGDGWPNTPRQATPEEVKPRLIEEAERRGYKDGIKFRDLDTGNIRTIVSNVFPLVTIERLNVSTPSKEWIINNGASNPYIYDNGKWAEIIDEKAEIRESVARLEAELQELKSKL